MLNVSIFGLGLCTVHTVLWMKYFSWSVGLNCYLAWWHRIAILISIWKLPLQNFAAIKLEGKGSTRGDSGWAWGRGSSARGGRRWHRLLGRWPTDAPGLVALEAFSDALSDNLNFWLALQRPGSWTRWSLKVPSDWTALFYSKRKIYTWIIYFNVYRLR